MSTPSAKKVAFRSGVLSHFWLISLPLLITVFLLAIASYQWTKYKSEHGQLKDKLGVLIATYSLVLAKPLAEDNTSEIDLYTIALLSDTDISEVKIETASGAIVQDSGAGVHINDSAYKQSIDITYLDQGRLKTVGKLTIGVTDQAIATQLNQMLTDSLLLLVALLIASSFGMYIAYKRAVGYPLSLLLSGIFAYRRHRNHQTISYEKPDEFKEVIDAYNEMQEHEIQLRDEIKQYQTELEIEVRETKALQVQLQYEASHDSLTNLYNRRTFDRRLSEVLGQTDLPNKQGAVICMDLDRFKIVNDTCGHIAGDALLKELSATFAAQVAGKGVIARLGGDEFAIFTEGSTLPESLALAESIRKTTEEFGFSWQGKYFEIGISIGLVPYAGNSTDVHTLMSAADTACYEAKEQGRNCIKVYRDDDSKIVNKLYQSEMVTILTESLKHNRFELWFQQLVALSAEGAERGHTYELLIRMRNDRGELVCPGLFLPAAERFGLATKIDSWVVAHAFDFLNSHPDLVESTQMCLINLSGLSIGDEKFLSQIIELRQAARFSPEKICFEITETAAIINMPKAKKFIKILQALGFKFALDDFGSGMSSFEYLKNLPLDILKIDGSFIREITKDDKHASIVEAMVQVGKVMGKKVVAEFVEDEATYQKLKTMQIDYAQGYHLSYPAPVSELLADNTLQITHN